jgi:D-alanyl-lipoteichoic acid acyltransferase DltB (MBOAT superfamily)
MDNKTITTLGKSNKAFLRTEFGFKNILQAKAAFGVDTADEAYEIMKETHNLIVEKERNDKIKAEKNIVDYSLFVSFFPLLVAGPIERATHLLPQLKVKRAFDYSKTIDGLRQILWGLFKKVVIADQCAKHANLIFDHYQDYSGITLLAGAVFFAFQIYGDFSGYSDIALGTARLFGVELLQNFSFPYFSRNISEFWRRWHISLSSWFRDYLYIPLGGGKGGLYIKLRNTLIIFLVSGFWHGANWTFVIWGLVNAIYIFPIIIFNIDVADRNIVAKGKILPTLMDVAKISLTFFLVVLAWIFFRASNLDIAFQIIFNILKDLISYSSYIELYNLIFYEIGFTVLILLIFFVLIEWTGRFICYPIFRF